jgi:hypothetical protein
MNSDSKTRSIEIGETGRSMSKKGRKYCVINGQYNNNKTEVETSTPNLYSEISVKRDVGGPPRAGIAPGWSCRISYLYRNLAVARELHGARL